MFKFKHTIAINVGTAVLVAAVVPAMAFGLISLSLTIIYSAFLIALAHATLLGLPIYLILSRKRKLTCLISTFAGFIIGCIPAAILFFPYRHSPHFYSSSNGVETFVDGIPTLHGWIQYATFVSYLGLFGVLGGFAFWLTLKGLDRSNSTQKQTLPLTSPQIFFPLVVVITSITISMLPIITKDRSCHNVLRGGESNIASVLALKVEITHDDWPQMTDFFVQFAEEYGLEYRDSSEFEPEVYQILYLSMCHESGFQFHVNEQKWDYSAFPVPLPPEDDFVRIAVYEFGGETNLKPVARNLILDAKKRWPGKVSIQSGQDYIE